MVLSARRGFAIVPLCALATTLAASTVGCTSVPTFASVRDAGHACSTTSPCASGQSCLQGVCYAACDATHACSMRETCTSGVCMPRTSDGGITPRDMGVDGGFCEMTTCATPTPVCHGDVALCTQCGDDNRDECGLATGPVCDVGRGTCTGATPTLCGPCNVTADCPSGLACVHRMAPDADERVCLPSCTTTCTDQGFTCTTALCIPFVGSCTAYRAALSASACATDADCPQLGATVDNGLVTGMCFDGGSGSATCHAACGSDPDCPPGLACAPPPSGGTINFCQ